MNITQHTIDSIMVLSSRLSAIADYEVKDEKVKKMLNDIAYKLYILCKDLEEM